MENKDNTNIEYAKPNLNEVEQNVEFLKEFSNIKFVSDTVAEQYDAVHGQYAKSCEIVAYNDPEIVSQACKKVSLPNDAKILDLGCGQGWVCECLKTKGYNNFVGIDASEKMLEGAKTSGMYKDLRKMFVGNGEMPKEFNDSFDACVSAGCLIPGHFPNSAFDEMHNILKEGGYLIFSVRAKYYGSLGHEAYIENMAKEGKFKFIDRLTFKKFEGMEEIKDMGLFAPDMAHVITYQKMGSA